MGGILMSGRDTEKGLCDVRLLLVDDDAFSRKLMLEILRKRGICVDVADNGAEAVEKVGQADYAAVLMDCRMPVMDGFEATRKIRADRRFADLPILAMSGDATEDDQQKCLECGMNGCIAKPIDVGQLFTTLGTGLKSLLDRTGQRRMAMKRRIFPDWKQIRPCGTWTATSIYCANSSFVSAQHRRIP